MAGLLRQICRPSLIRSPVFVCQPYRFIETTEDKPQSYSKDALQALVQTNKVVVFMKGNPEAPRCGFSNAVVQIMRMHGVPYDAHDVLLSDELRQNIKEFSDWPTIPQVYMNGEFVGGCDILLQMHQSGELIEELKRIGIQSNIIKEAVEKAVLEKKEAEYNERKNKKK